MTKTVHRSTRIRETHADNIFNAVNLVFWILVLAIVLYPLYLILIASVSDPDAVLQARVLLWPVDFSLMGYQAVFQYSELWGSYANSVFYTLVGSLRRQAAGEPGHYLYHVLFRRTDPDFPQCPGPGTV